MPRGLFRPFPKIPSTPTWVQKHKAWPQGNALVTLIIIVQGRQRKDFPVSHCQSVREVSFYLPVLFHTNRCPGEVHLAMPELAA